MRKQCRAERGAEYLTIKIGYAVSTEKGLRSSICHIVLVIQCHLGKLLFVVVVRSLITPSVGWLHCF